MSEALISSEILRWARERARLEPARLAEKAHVKLEKLMLWEQGDKRPSFLQAQKLARVLHIPFGYLFLPHPPQETLPIPDLRTVGDHQTHEISPDLRDVLSDVMRKQDWYRDYLLDRGAEPLPFVGRFDLAASVNEIAADITEVLDVTLTHRDQVRNGEEYLSLLMSKVDETGILVMRSGIVGSNTHRGLDVHEFRGFAICDDIAPVVFLNGKDAKAAQIFTLIHELAHIWVGLSGISDLSLESRKGDVHIKSERLCNAVAAEVLVPEVVFLERWAKEKTLEDNAGELATYFRVSSVVIARRAVDLDLVNWQTYYQFYREQARLWRNQKERDKERPGGSPYRTIPVRNGRSFTEAVVRTALERKLLLRDAGRLLGLHPSNIGKLGQKIGIG